MELSSSAPSGFKSRISDVLLAVLFPGLLIIAGLLIPIVMISLDRDITAGTFLVSLIISYAGVRLVMVALGGRGRVLQLFFWVFSWIFLGLAPMAQLAVDDWPWPSAVPESLLWRAALVVLLSFASYDLGLIVSKRNDTREVRPSLFELDPRKLKVAAVIAVIACVSQIARIGPGTLLSDRAARAAASSTTDTATAAISNALLVSVVFVVGYLFIVAKRQGLIHGYMMTTIVLVGLTLFVSNPLSSARYRVATVLSGLVLAFIWPITRRHLALLGAAVLLGLAFLFPLLNTLRKANTLNAGDGILLALRQGDYDAFQQIANTISYVDANGHTFGNQMASSIFFFIPRSIWEGKGLDTGVLVAEFREYGFTNLSAPLQAEAFIDGGVLLVFILFLLIGIVTGWFERRASNPSSLTSYIALVVPMIAAYQVIMLRGSLLQSMAGFAAILVIIALCMRKRTLGVSSGLARRGQTLRT